jgi:hypothetical protein
MMQAESKEEFAIRQASKEDVPLILDFIYRLEWAVLDWNEPSIEFYKSLEARLMDEWIVNRISGEKLHKLADRF